jgi:hypothetical protein
LIANNLLKDLRKHLSGINKEVDKAVKDFANDKEKGYESIRHAIKKVNSELHLITDRCASGQIPASVCAKLIPWYRALRQQLVFKGQSESQTQCKNALTAVGWNSGSVKDCSNDNNINFLLTSSTRCAGTNLNKAQKEFCKGVTELMMGRTDQICGKNAEDGSDETTARKEYNRAIQHYKHAWKHFTRAIKAAANWNPDTDPYYDTIYDDDEEDPNQVNP